MEAGAKVSFEDMRKFYCDKDWMIDRIDQFEWDVKMLMKMAPYAAIQYIRKRIGYDDFLKEYAFTHQINRSDLNEVLAEIEEAAKAFSSVEEWFAHVEEYTETLKVKEKERNRPRPGVRLMTIHASKGLEFKQVFLIAANEGRIPYQKAKTDKEIEEERRLFYVAMTRAKDFLKICYFVKFSFVKYSLFHFTWCHYRAFSPAYKCIIEICCNAAVFIYCSDTETDGKLIIYF